MKSIKTIIRNKTTKVDGTAPIYFQYSYDREKRTLLKTGKYIEPAFWSEDKQKVKPSHPAEEQINDFLKSQRLKLEKIIDDALMLKQDPTINFVIEKYKTEVLLNAPKVNGFYDILDQYVETAKSRISKGIISDYGTLKQYLQDFEEFNKTKVSFATITKASTYDDFLNYLKTQVKNQRGGKGLKVNSVGKHAKNLKAFLNNCIRREIIPHTDLRFMKNSARKLFPFT